VRSFFDEVSQGCPIRFAEHRIGNPRIIRLIQKWLKAGVLTGLSRSLRSFHARGAPGWTKRAKIGRAVGIEVGISLGAVEPVEKFDRRPFEHP